MILKIRLLSDEVELPVYAHGSDEDAGFDLRAAHDVNLQPYVPTLVKTGLSIELPPGFEAQIRPRSGLALKYGLTIPNSPGTVDPSFRGEVGVILQWLTQSHIGASQRLPIRKGDRIAQMIISRYEPVKFEVVSDLTDTSRGTGGFGSSGR